MWKISPQCVSVDAFLNEQFDWISSNKFHMRKISPHCVTVDAFLNGQIGWISSNNFHMRKIIPIGTVEIENL